MKIILVNPHFLWLLLLALPMAILAWWARRRRKVVVGSLVLWQLTIKNCPPPNFWRRLPVEIFCTLLFFVSAVLALAMPQIKITTMQKSDDEKSPMIETLTVNHLRVVGGELFISISNHSATTQTAKIIWSSAEKKIGELPISLAAQNGEAYTLPINNDAAEIIVEVDIPNLPWQKWTVEKITSAEINAGEFPAIARALTATKIAINSPKLPKLPNAQLLVTNNMPVKIVSSMRATRAIFLIAPKNSSRDLMILSEKFSVTEIMRAPENPTSMSLLTLRDKLFLPKTIIPSSEIWLNAISNNEKIPLLAHWKTKIDEQKIDVIYFADLPDEWIKSENFPLTIAHLLDNLCVIKSPILSTSETIKNEPAIFPPDKIYNLTNIMILFALGGIGAMIWRIK